MSASGPQGGFAGVVFDNDGLLLNTEVAWTRAEAALFAARDAEFTDDHKRALIGSSRARAAALLEDMLGRPGEGDALMSELHDRVMDELLAGVAPMPGARALVDALLAAGTPIAVATNSGREFAERALAVSGMRERFDVVVTASEVAHGKPAPDVYLEACRRLGADPARCAGLEDSPTGAAAVRAAGLFVVGVPSFAGVALEDVDLLADSLEDPALLRLLDVVEAARGTI